MEAQFKIFVLFSKKEEITSLYLVEMMVCEGFQEQYLLNRLQ